MIRGPDHPIESGGGDAEFGAKGVCVGAIELGDFRFNLGRQRDHFSVRPAGERGESECRGPDVELPRVGLVGVNDDEKGFQRKEREPSHSPELFLGELEVAKGHLLLEGSEALSNRLQVLLVLVAVRLLDGQFELREAALGDGVVRENQLRLHRGRISGGVDRSLDVRDRFVVETAYDVRQGVHGSELFQR